MVTSLSLWPPEMAPVAGLLDGAQGANTITNVVSDTNSGVNLLKRLWGRDFRRASQNKELHTHEKFLNYIFLIEF